MTPRDVLEAQVDAWNRGDIDAFCAWCSDDTVYLSPAGPRRGRAELAAGYRAQYPDRAAMGTLSLAIDALDLSGDRATAVVRWALTGTATRGGWALLVFARVGDTWALTHDATFVQPAVSP